MATKVLEIPNEHILLPEIERFKVFAFWFGERLKLAVTDKDIRENMSIMSECVCITGPPLQHATNMTVETKERTLEFSQSDLTIFGQTEKRAELQGERAITKGQH